MKKLIVVMLLIFTSLSVASTDFACPEDHQLTAVCEAATLKRDSLRSVKFMNQALICFRNSPGFGTTTIVLKSSKGKVRSVAAGLITTFGERTNYLFRIDDVLMSIRYDRSEKVKNGSFIIFPENSDNDFERTLSCEELSL